MDNPYYEKLMNAALRFVSYRPRSETELRDFLRKKLDTWKVSGTVLTDKVVTRMGELGYVDDRKFADWWVLQRTTFRPKGNRVIELELRQKGVSKAVISSILASRGSESLLTAARKAIAKKMPVWANLPYLARKKKLYDYLGRRGFNAETIALLVDDNE